MTTFILRKCSTWASPVQRILAALLWSLTILLGTAGTASGAYFDATSKNRVGVLGPNPNIYSYALGYPDLEPPREFTITGYDPATGVVFYVRQNPWTKIDPLGLQGDRETKSLDRDAYVVTEDENGNRKVGFLEKTVTEGRSGRSEEYTGAAFSTVGVSNEELSEKDLNLLFESAQANYKTGRELALLERDRSNLGLIPGAKVGEYANNGEYGKAAAMFGAEVGLTIAGAKLIQYGGKALKGLGRGSRLAAKGINQADNVVDGLRLNQQLRLESANSVFDADGSLSQGALNGSKQIFAPGTMENTNIPAGFGKCTTATYQSPSGSFQVHFYKNPTSGEVFYGLDYKAVFNSGGVSP
jgi:hypothetical protein